MIWPTNCGRVGIGRCRRGGCIIPKPGTSEQRPLSIPAVRDRIVQAAVKIVLEPIFEADFAAVQLRVPPEAGSAHDALQVLMDETWRGRRWVVETDIADCFSAIPHDRLMQAVEERVVDQSGAQAAARDAARGSDGSTGVVRASGHRHPARRRRSVPLLCNVYLHRLDRAWDTRAFGVLVRFADDLLVVCRSRQQAEAALARLRQLLAELGLAPKEAKTRIVALGGGRRGFRLPRLPPPDGAVAGRARQARCRVPGPLARGQGDAACAGPDQRVHGPVPAVAAGRGGRGGPQQVPAGLGELLPLRPLRDPLRQDQQLRARSVGGVHRQAAQTRTRASAGPCSPTGRQTSCGLINLNGTVIAPRADKPWREKPNAGGERRR